MKPAPAAAVIIASILLAGCGIGVTSDAPPTRTSAPPTIGTPPPSPSTTPTSAGSSTPSDLGSPTGPETGETHNITPTSFPTPTTTVDRRSAQPTGAAGKARGLNLGTVDRRDPKAVAGAFVATAWNYDTAIDKTPNDAGRRAAIWATPSYAAELKAAESKAGPGAWWNEIAAHRGYTTVTLSYGGLGEPPPDTPTQAYAAVTVTPTPTDGKSWTGEPLPPSTLIITLTRADSTHDWAVATMRSA